MTNYFQLQCITYTFVCVWRLFIIRTYLSGNSIVGSIHVATHVKVFFHCKLNLYLVSILNACCKLLNMCDICTVQHCLCCSLNKFCFVFFIADDCPRDDAERRSSELSLLSQNIVSRLTLSHIILEKKKSLTVICNERDCLSMITILGST